MGGQGLAHGPAGAQDQVGSPLGHAGLLKDLEHLHVGHHRVGGGLKDDAVAGGQGRGNLPGPHDEGEVPRTDEGHHPHRLMDGEGVHLSKAFVDLIAAAVRGLDQAGIVAVAVQGVVHVALGLPQGFAHVHGLDAGQFVPVLVDEVGNLQEDIPPGLAVHVPPIPGLVEGGSGSSHRQVHVFGGTHHHFGQNLTGGRVVGRGGLSADAIHPFAVDIIFTEFHTLPPNSINGRVMVWETAREVRVS